MVKGAIQQQRKNEGLEELARAWWEVGMEEGRAVLRMESAKAQVSLLTFRRAGEDQLRPRNGKAQAGRWERVNDGKVDGRGSDMEWQREEE